jgi:hypothetical protein
MCRLGDGRGGGLRPAHRVHRALLVARVQALPHIPEPCAVVFALRRINLRRRPTPSLWRARQASLSTALHAVQACPWPSAPWSTYKACSKHVHKRGARTVLPVWFQCMFPAVRCLLALLRDAAHVQPRCTLGVPDGQS